MNVVFGPNLGSVDYLALFQQPETWADVRAQLSGFKIYGDTVRSEPFVGPNTYEALTAAGVFRKLVDWTVPLVLETAAIKEWDTEGAVLQGDVVRLVQRIQDAGGDVHEIAMDEPLASTVVGAFRRSLLQLGPEAVGDTARHTADWVRVASGQGAAVGLIEAYPYHNAATICGFVRDIVLTNQTALAYLELDVDFNGISDQGLSAQQVADDMSLFRSLCATCSMPIRAIVTSLRATDDTTYHAQALENFARLKPYGFDGYTVQSWLESPAGVRTIPVNRPTHLDTVRAVLGG